MAAVAWSVSQGTVCVRIKVHVCIFACVLAVNACLFVILYLNKSYYVHA